MDIREIRKLVKGGATVVLLEEGQTPLVVSELHTPEEAPVTEVPIASRWPKGLPAERQGRTIHDGPLRQSVSEASPPRPERSGPDQVLERLNKEILALQAEIAQQEGGTAENH